MTDQLSGADAALTLEQEELIDESLYSSEEPPEELSDIDRELARFG